MKISSWLYSDEQKTERADAAVRGGLLATATLRYRVRSAAVTLKTAVCLGLLLAVCALTPNDSFGQGGPPMLTDDPGTPGDGQWEINTAFLEDRTASTRARSFPHVDLNYGWGDHIQLK